MFVMLSYILYSNFNTIELILSYFNCKKEKNGQKAYLISSRKSIFPLLSFSTLNSVSVDQSKKNLFFIESLQTCTSNGTKMLMLVLV